MSPGHGSVSRSTSESQVICIQSKRVLIGKMPAGHKPALPSKIFVFICAYSWLNKRRRNERMETFNPAPTRASPAVNRFADREAFHTLLYDEKEGFRPLGHLRGVLAKNDSPRGARDRKGFISYWQGNLRSAAARRGPHPQGKTAETLLRKTHRGKRPSPCRRRPTFSP